MDAWKPIFVFQREKLPINQLTVMETAQLCVIQSLKSSVTVQSSTQDQKLDVKMMIHADKRPEMSTVNTAQITPTHMVAQ